MWHSNGNQQSQFTEDTEDRQANKPTFTLAPWRGTQMAKGEGQRTRSSGDSVT